MWWRLSVESDAKGFIFHHGKLADEHVCEGRVSLIMIGFLGGGRRLSRSNEHLLTERWRRRREILRCSSDKIHQTIILQLWETLTTTTITLTHTERERDGVWPKRTYIYTLMSILTWPLYIILLNKWLQKTLLKAWKICIYSLYFTVTTEILYRTIEIKEKRVILYSDLHFNIKTKTLAVCVYLGVTGHSVLLQCERDASRRVCVVFTLDLSDGKRLLLCVLTHTDHKQNLSTEQQTARVFLTRTAHHTHFQSHVQLRTTQRL